MLSIHDNATVSDLPEGMLPTDFAQPNGVVVYSLTAHALSAMERHKWIESEKHGRDIGQGVFPQWVDYFWTGFVRARLMEHLYGWRCWGAFDVADFGLLARTTVSFHVPRALLNHVAMILRNGGENLDVIAWATEAGHNLEAVIWVLERIDINAKRHRLLTDHIRLFIDERH